MILDSVAEIAKKNHIPFCVYFHEMLSQYNFVNRDSLKSMVTDSLFTIGCSEAVCENLKILGSKKVLKQFECIDTKKIDDIIFDSIPAIINEKKSEGYKIITMSGQRIDRKGFDIFVYIAKELRDEAIHFLWLGSSRNSSYEYFIECLIASERVNNITIIHPKNNEYYQYLNSTDLFFLSSIEDPFPLVMLEAAYLSKYIISFNSGGVSEFLKNHNGLLLNSTNIKSCAKVIKNVLNSVEFKQNIITKDFEYGAEIQTKYLEKLLFDNILKG
jgi:glycosyltransferase involved in cell wall biosynthesis